MKVIITGASGMVGGGAFQECLESSHVSEILLINRRSLNITHPKVREIIHSDFSSFDAIAPRLKGYDLCMHCMGKSFTETNEAKYRYITYDITVALVDTLYGQNPNMVFCYISGAGSDSTESSYIMWLRIKGMAENYILSRGFRDAYVLRPGIIVPEKGIKSRTPAHNFVYTVLRPFFPLLRKLSYIATSTTNIGKAMINLALQPQDAKHVENRDINRITLSAKQPHQQ